VICYNDMETADQDQEAQLVGVDKLNTGDDLLNCNKYVPWGSQEEIALP